MQRRRVAIMNCETHASKVQSFNALVRSMIAYTGEDPDREGLQDTPRRVREAWGERFGGYSVDPVALLKMFEDGAQGCDEMIVVRGIPFYSHCEHHLAPFFGTATVAYIPHGRIIGLSKINRLVDAYARRLQVQERFTNQIADTLWAGLIPLGVGVIVRARHLCIESRGVGQQGSIAITSAVKGAMKDDPRARAEFLNLANGD